MSAGDRVVVVVSGVVQGVGFRWFVHRAASGLGVTGWVRNRRDGSVELVAEGSPASIAALVATVGEGPDGAWVRDVAVRHEPPTGSFAAFEIRPGSHPGD